MSYAGGFKAAYSDRESYAQREIRVRQSFENLSGITLKLQGLEAESAEVIKGYSVQNGGIRGEAHYCGLNGLIQFEVTGSSVPLKADADLWVRPDKLDAALAKSKKGCITAVGHEMPTRDGSTLKRLILLTPSTLTRYADGKFRTVTVRPKGIPETYVCIPANDPCVYSWWSGCVAAWQAACSLVPPFMRPAPGKAVQRDVPNAGKSKPSWALAMMQVGTKRAVA